MYCAFVDFEKAFDNIWRVALWYKLLLNNINGKMYNFIVNMYNSIKSCIVYNDFFFIIQEVYIFCSSTRGKNHNFCFVNVYFKFPQFIVFIKII
jgi:hypothetical protein